MAYELSRPLWVPAAQRFRSAVTGRWISFEAAIPELRWKSGALRDVGGQYVPWKYWGGDPYKGRAFGDTGTTNVWRHLPGPVEEFTPRLKELIGGKATYTVFEEKRPPISVNLPSGTEYDEKEFNESLAGMIAFTETGGYGWEEIPTGVDVVSVDWYVQTWYFPGESALGEREYWG